MVQVFLDPDEPIPLCVIVRPDQRLEVINRMVRVVHGRAQRGEIRFGHLRPQPLPVGSTLVFRQPFKAYLTFGEHSLYYLGIHTSVDLWLRRPSARTSP